MCKSQGTQSDLYVRIFSAEQINTAARPVDRFLLNDTVLAEIIRINEINKLSKYPTIPELKMIEDLPIISKLKRFGVTEANISYYEISFF